MKNNWNGFEVNSKENPESNILSSMTKIFDHVVSGANPGGATAAAAPPKTYESNCFHHDFVQFGKQHLRYKAIFPSIVSSQQSCEIFFITLTSLLQRDYKICQFLRFRQML